MAHRWLLSQVSVHRIQCLTPFGCVISAVEETQEAFEKHFELQLTYFKEMVRE